MNRISPNKYSNTHRIGIPEGKEKETGEIFEAIMSKKFPKLLIDIKPQTQKSQKTPSRKQFHKIYTQAYHIQTSKTWIKEQSLRSWEWAFGDGSCL